jgi:hypothetical protein
MASRVPVYNLSVKVNLEIAVKDVYEDVVLRPWPSDEPEPQVNPG